MPPDEGVALYEAAHGAGRRRAAARGRQLLRQVGGLPRCRRPGARAGCCSRVDHHRGSEENQAGLGVARARPGRPGGRPDGHAAVVPAHHPRRRPRGHGRRGGRRLAGGRRRTGRRRWRCCSSTAATASSRPTATTRLDAARRAGRPARHPRRVPRPGRRRPPARTRIYLPALAVGPLRASVGRPARSGCSTVRAARGTGCPYAEPRQSRLRRPSPQPGRSRLTTRRRRGQSRSVTDESASSARSARAAPRRGG